MSDRPNIILIATDQQRFDSIQAAGNHHVWTPHLNWLVDNGIHFRRAYSDCAVCMPARVTVVTGRHAYRHGITSNKFIPGVYRDELTLPGLLTAAGYQTRMFGKNHHGRTGRHLAGFQHQETVEDYYRYMARHPERGSPQAHGIGQNENVPVIDTVDERNSLTRWIVDRTVDFLETREPGKPFFAWLNFFKPHPPFDPCRNYWELYRDKAVPSPVRGNWSNNLEDIPPAFLGVTRELSMTQRLDPQEMAQVQRAYYACITQIDYQLGVLFARLRDLNLLENTWIIFTSDHGEMLGDHHMGGKCVPFEGAAHVPMLVKAPFAARDHLQPSRGITCDSLVCLADLLPTCCQIAGVDVPAEAGVDGLSMLDLMNATASRERLYGTCMYLHYVVDGDYKYCRETLGGHELLFHLGDDPREEHDLIRAGTAKEVHQRLSRLMDAHIAENRLDQPSEADDAVARSDVNLPNNVHPGWHTKIPPFAS